MKFKADKVNEMQAAAKVLGWTEENWHLVPSLTMRRDVAIRGASRGGLPPPQRAATTTHCWLALTGFAGQGSRPQGGSAFSVRVFQRLSPGRVFSFFF